MTTRRMNGTNSSRFASKSTTKHLGLILGLN